jgi:hypothetical protein
MFFEEVYMRLSVSAAQSMTELRLQKKLCYSRYMKVKNFLYSWKEGNNHVRYHHSFAK